jgi:hypothetical protein
MKGLLRLFVTKGQLLGNQLGYGFAGLSRFRGEHSLDKLILRNYLELAVGGKFKVVGSILYQLT